MSDQRCPACGEHFDCAMDRHPEQACWCTQVPVDPGALTALAEVFDGCLCPRCLRARSQDVVVRSAPRT
jgi:hypothetical protein